ncbi:MAG: site-specific integrase, partial [Candidatus Pacebacteria bacterium]|nr:site-specific integrase [Candidatus Paceibacterota bacterium]
MPAKIKQSTSQKKQKQPQIALLVENYSEKPSSNSQDSINQTKEIKKNLNNYLLAVKDTGCSTATIRNYKSDIKQFLDFLGENNLDGLRSKPKLLAFAKYQREKGLKDSSIKRKIVSIGQFKNWLKKEGLLKSEIPLSSKQIESAPSKDLKAIDARRSLDQEAQALGADGENLAKLSHKPRRRPNKLALILNVIALLFFIGGLGYLAYQQFGQAVLSLAYPSLPTSPNRILSFQGRLTNTARTPIASETKMNYELYDDVTGGN